MEVMEMDEKGILGSKAQAVREAEEGVFDNDNRRAGTKGKGRNEPTPTAKEEASVSKPVGKATRMGEDPPVGKVAELPEVSPAKALPPKMAAEESSAKAVAPKTSTKVPSAKALPPKMAAEVSSMKAVAPKTSTEVSSMKAMSPKVLAELPAMAAPMPAMTSAKPTESLDVAC
jgi:hypothetical protein